VTWHCLVEVEPFDPIADARVTLRLASAELREITGLGGVSWAPALAEAPKTAITLFEGGFGDTVKPGGARLPIVLPRARDHFAFVDRAFWPGAAVKIYVGRAGDAWPWTLHFVGKVASFQTQDGTLGLGCEVDDSAFQADVLTAAYAGTGDEEGGADLKGKPKPLVLGHAKNVEPVLIDTANSVFQFSAYGAIEAVDALFERASDFGAATGDYADYDALVAASIPPGRWATCLAQGMVRLGAPAYGLITGDVRGHRVGSSTPRLTGAVIRALAGIAGVDSGRLATASLDAMDIAAPYPINIVVSEQSRWIDLARRLALPCNHQAGISLVGQFFVAGIAFGESTAGQPRFEVTDVSELSVSPPYARTMLGANRCWRVQTADEIAFEAPLVPRGLYKAGETYRLGNVVSLPDQSEWLYINETPGSGHAPPVWPTTSNTWWSNTKPPATAEGIKYADGTPIEDLKPAQPGATTNVGRGIYSDAAAYDVGDMVVWAIADGGDGNGYIRIGTGTTTGVLPSDTSKWAVWVERGQDGAPGVSTAEVYLYKRSDTPLSAHGMTGTFTYTFGDATLAGGNLNGWTKTIPAGSEQLYVIAASAASNAATDTIAANEFSAPTPLSQAGADGANGFNSATIMLFQRAASAPAVPAGTLTYTFSTGALSGTVSPWSTTAPAHNGNPIWMTTATAISQSGSDNIASGEWATPQKIAEDGQDGIPGAPGADGQTLYTWVAYADSADGTVNFTTGNPGSRLYMGLAANKPTATEGTSPSDYVWARFRGEDGAQGLQGVQGQPGADGAPTYIWVAYADSADGTVNFTTGAPGTRTYMGVAPNKATPTEGSDPNDYNWAKIQGPQGPQGSAGSNGRDAIVYFQEGAPSSGMIAGDTWYKPSTKQLSRYNGASWVQMLGSLAAMDVLNANFIVAGTIIASKFLTDQGVDLAAMVPGSINWRASLIDPTDLGGSTSDFDTGIVAISGTGSATPSSVISPAVSQTLWVGPSGGLTATANLDVYYRINGGSWIYIGRQTLSFGSTSPSGTTQSNNSALLNGSTPVTKFSPSASGTIQFGYRHYSSHQGSGTFTFTSLDRSLTFEVVNWK